MEQHPGFLLAAEDEPGGVALAPPTLRAPRAAVSSPARPVPARTGTPARPVIYGYRILGNMPGSSTAYLAMHTATQANCVIRTVALQEHAAVACLLREGELLARLAHPGIVRERGSGIVGEHAYLVTEYIHGAPLKPMLGRAWAPLEAVRLLAGVARGLRAVHEAGILLGRLRPQAIMLRADSLAPMLLDFGAAQELDAARCAPAGSVLGAPGYMAPEVITGQACGPASDVYACGVMFHELLAGAAPYAARQPTALLRQHLKAPLPQLPERLDAFQPLLERMLAKDPARRLANGAALAAEMEQVWQAMCS